MEGFTREEAAAILEADEEEIAGLLASAIEEIDRQTVTEVLIIEDEPIIAMDLEGIVQGLGHRSEEHTSELQSLMRISYAVFCLKKKKQTYRTTHVENTRKT